VIELRQDHPLPALLKTAGLARSTFYYQAKVLEAGDRFAGLKESEPSMSATRAVTAIGASLSPLVMPARSSTTRPFSV